MTAYLRVVEEFLIKQQNTPQKIPIIKEKKKTDIKYN